MDQDFFASLEESISNVGTDEVWKSKIGEREIWLSPIPFLGQAKVQDALSSDNLGSNVINESKRITLSHAIVGIDDIDLRPYRNSGHIFGPISLPGGKQVKVDLSTYIYHKMLHWGSQFIDDCFSVFADRLETHGKNNVKDIKFENAKHPMEELGELMLRVTELRIQLGLPELTEKPDEDEELDEAREFSRSIDRTPESKPEPDLEPEPEVEFDPFRTVRVDSKTPTSPPVSKRVNPEPVREPVLESDSNPVNTVPVLLPPQVSRRAQAFSDLEGHAPTSSPSNPFVASKHDDILEPQHRESQIAPPVIDAMRFSRNPRFNPPHKT